MKKQRYCKKRNCREIPETNGFCSKHYLEDLTQRQLEEDAVRLLHRSTVDEELVTEPSLKIELLRVQKWWVRACDAINFQRADPVLKNEVEYATSWCIAIARGIIIAERAHRKGSKSTYDLEAAGAWVWDRFDNLEKGFMSNGIPYPKR